MAPEIINNTSGYSYYVDLWSIGVCLYEFLGKFWGLIILAKRLPYNEDITCPYELA